MEDGGWMGLLTDYLKSGDGRGLGAPYTEGN